MSTHVAKNYVPTIINDRLLLPRLVSELCAIQQECKLAWPDFKRHPGQATINVARVTVRKSRQVLFASNVLAALAVVLAVVVTVILFERKLHPTPSAFDSTKPTLAAEVTIIKLDDLDKKPDDGGIGRNGKGRVGFQQSSGEGSGEVRRRSQGGGGSGDHDPLPAQKGGQPPPSNIQASIPKTPPVHQPSLPVAGIDIDPALWQDLKAPTYGDPRSTSEVSSKGPGDGGSIGTGRGLGIGDGTGSGVGPGNDGNIGGGLRAPGCCGIGGSDGNSAGVEQRPFRSNEVEQRARLLAKPEPQYTEEARRNQITGTVMLRVVFSAFGQVEQIRAMQSLPFGLTERAIAAARQIKFVPATKGGRPVSVYMQLEYNFNLY
ncbi:MAG TPA: TonB family protein [Pyrinomonadaceae bacterium]|jgi:TonB family protein|nr:TonB family protein [Pyrinomonadaceae bacterium]